MPQQIQALLAAAREANKAGRFKETEELAAKALELEPENPEPNLLLGMVWAQMGILAAARDSLAKATKKGPTEVYACSWLSYVCRRMGAVDEAASYATRALAINPNDPMALEQLGQCCLNLHRPAEAEVRFREAISRNPARPSLHDGLGMALAGQGRSSEALLAFRRATEIEPRTFPAQLHLARALHDVQDYQGSIEAADRALSLMPESTEARFVLIYALFSAKQPTEAEAQLKHLTETGDPSATTFAMVGNLLQQLGRLEEANSYFQRALAIDPVQPEACLGMSRGKRLTEADRAFVDQMTAAVARSGISESDEMNLRYALGKACEDRANYEEAMAHFDVANRLALLIKFGDVPFNQSYHRANDDRAIQLFSKELMTRHGGEGFQSDLPIVVLGMMRSGTTLTEQILSSHPEVGGAGEQPYWMDNRQKALDPQEFKLTAGGLRELGEGYCRLLRDIAPGKRHVVDKMPDNWAVIPLIHLSLPNARFVHVRRNPVDTCISIYATPNDARTDWSHNKENIVFYYREYLRTMEAWRKIMPKDRMIEIDYEELVADQERVTRQLIEFCGLPWDDLCLHPERTERLVVTPSSWQVRQKVYKSSVERWRRYEPWLGAFSELIPK